MIREIMQSAYHPSEISAMVKMKVTGMSGVKVKAPLEYFADNTSDKEFCYTALNKVSRSFAVVIRHLPDELKDAVCIFYLVLRGLDSIEDDTKFPNHVKIPLLKNFYAKNYERNWCLAGVGDSDDYRALLSNYGKVARSFQSLDKKYQQVILDICKRMGAGMAEFSERQVKTVEEYDLYCHYVAGLVGIGLSELFAVSGLEDTKLCRIPELSNSMGLFLQKTNIIRDFHEDLFAGRLFWPEEVWKQHANDAANLIHFPVETKALHCLNYMVSDALQHAPQCIEYVSHLNNPHVFRFCVIPQVMAMATLAKVYNNSKVFTGSVKIRKGLAARLMTEINNYKSFKSSFEFFGKEVFNSLSKSDPRNTILLERLFEIFVRCNVSAP